MGSINDNHYTTGAVYSRRGSNPRPPAHKTGALPLSYRSCHSGCRQRSNLARNRAKNKYSGPEKAVIPDGTRTHSLRLRKPTPCPFGHWDACLKWGSNPRGLKAQQILSLPPWTSRAFRHMILEAAACVCGDPQSFYEQKKKKRKIRSYRDLNPD